VLVKTVLQITRVLRFVGVVMYISDIGCVGGCVVLHEGRR